MRLYHAPWPRLFIPYTENIISTYSFMFALYNEHILLNSPAFWLSLWARRLQCPKESLWRAQVQAVSSNTQKSWETAGKKDWVELQVSITQLLSHVRLDKSWICTLTKVLINMLSRTGSILENSIKQHYNIVKRKSYQSSSFHSMVVTK